MIVAFFIEMERRVIPAAILPGVYYWHLRK